MRAIALSALQPAQRETADVVALEHDEEDERRDRRDERCRGEQRVLRAVLAGERREPDRRGPVLGVVRDDERPEEIVPLGEELEQEQRQERGPQQRHDDAKENAELARAVEPRRVDQLAWNAERELADEEDAGGARRTGNDQPVIGG